MPHAAPADRLLDLYDRGVMSRRSVIAGLTALATAGAARAAGPDGGNEPDGPLFSGRNVDHIALGVSDVGRSVAFYERFLGLKKLRGDDRSAFLGRADGGFFLALFRVDPERGEKPGLDHFCFGIDGYDPVEAGRALRAAGREVRQTGRRTYFKDPDGIEVQLAAKRSL